MILVITVMRSVVNLRGMPVFVVMNGLMASNAVGNFHVKKLLNCEKLLVAIGRQMISFFNMLFLDNLMSWTTKVATGIEIVAFSFT